MCVWGTQESQWRRSKMLCQYCCLCSEHFKKQWNVDYENNKNQAIPADQIMSCQADHAELLHQDGVGILLWWCRWQRSLLLFWVVVNVWRNKVNQSLWSRLHVFLIICLRVHLFFIVSECVSTGWVCNYLYVIVCMSLGPSLTLHLLSFVPPRSYTKISPFACVILFVAKLQESGYYSLIFFFFF